MALYAYVYTDINIFKFLLFLEMTLSLVLDRLISYLINNKWFRNKESGKLKTTEHSGLLTAVNKTQI